MKSELESYSAYYENTIRTMRAIKPALTRDEALKLVLRFCREDNAREGCSTEEAEHFLESCTQKFNDAWTKSELPALRN